MSTKYKVLDILSQQSGQFISGQAIADQLAVSRTAVWKAIQSLNKEGYQITTHPHQGYVIEKGPQTISEAAVRLYLAEELKDTTIKVFDEVTSTNTVAKQLIATDAPPFVLIVSSEQTAGKGRLGRQFYSPNSGIYFSFGWREQGNEPPQAGLITIMAAVACHMALKECYQVETTIKWVNDINYQGKKVGGILTEGNASLETGQLESIICGIGLNLVAPAEGFPADISARAGAIFSKKPENLDYNQLIAAIINHFMIFKNEQMAQGLAIYRQICDTIGQQISYTRGNQLIHGEALGIDDEGGLIVRKADGQQEHLYFGEVQTKIV